MYKRINLIPPEFATGKKALVETGLLNQIFIGTVVLLVIMAFLFLVSWLGLSGLKHDMKKMRKTYSQKSEISSNSKRSKETLQDQLDHVNEKIKELEGKKAKLGMLGDVNMKWSEILSAFNQAIPNNVWVDKLVLQHPSSQVIGGAFTNQNISKFIDHLNDNAFFSKASFVKTQSGTVNDKKVVLFELSFDLNRG